MLALAAAAFAPGSASAADFGGTFRPHGNCVEGTYTVPHGVTQVRVLAGGEDGGKGFDYVGYDADGNPVFTNTGGKGGYGAYVDATVPVSALATLYIGVASPNGTNMLPGGNNGGGGGNAGAGGAASWVSKGPRDPRLGPGGCSVPQSDLIVVAGGGGGGGDASSIEHSNGGPGGSEAVGGNGSDGSPNGSSRGRAGLFGSTAGGAGGVGGSHGGCTSGSPGAAGRALRGGDGGSAGFFDPIQSYTDIGIGLIGAADCSTSGILGSPYSFLGVRQGSDGGGGGGGYWGGGGGGGSANSGLAGAAGGAAGKSLARDGSMTVGRWGAEPFVSISPVLTVPSFSSDDHRTFTVGSSGFFTVHANGANSPYVTVPTSALPDGVHKETATFADGDGTGEMNLTGNPVRGGVYPLPISACNLRACVTQNFSLTVNEAPTITGPAQAVFQSDQPGSVTVNTNGWPRPSFTSSGKPGWLNVTDNGDGTATLSGTPPAGTSPNSYSFDLTASNGIGSPATQTITLTIVTSLTTTPASTRLVPGETSVTLSGYERGFDQQFRAIGTRPGGGTVDVTNMVNWSSSSPGVVNLNSSTGKGRGVALGTSTITARTATPTLSSQSFVTVAVPSSITIITPTTDDMARGTTRQLIAKGCYGDPCSLNSFDITDHVTWSELPHYATVDQNGLVTASSSGGASFISADLKSTFPPTSLHAEIRIFVTHGKVTSISLSPTSQTVPVKGTGLFQATTRYEDGFVSSNTQVSWSVVNPSGVEVARVPEPTQSASHIEGNMAGTATVRASYVNVNPAGPTVTGTATLNVISIPAGLQITAVDQANSTTPLLKGKTRKYIATAFYTDGTPDKVVTQGVKWTSGDPSAVTMAQDGTATAVGNSDRIPGVPIFASFDYTNVAGGTSTINSPGNLVPITIMPPPAISITPTTVPTLHPFGSQQFTAIATYADGSTLNVTNLVNWESDRTGIATISNGLLSVRGGTVQGTLHVDAYKGNVFSNSVTVTVTDPLDHVTVGTSPGAFQSPIQAGNVTGGLFVNGYDANNNYLEDVTYKSTFSIAAEGTCNSAARTCGGETAGLHTISATTPDAVHPTSTNTVSLMVVTGRIDLIDVTGGSSTIYANQATRPFVVTGYDRFGNSQNVTGSTNFHIAPDGACGPTASLAAATCTAQTQGAHTITARYREGLSGQLDVSFPLDVQSSLLLGSLHLAGGSSQVALNGKSAPFNVTATDYYGNAMDAGGLILQITGGGTCDTSRMTCTPTSLGSHTVTAKNVNGLVSNGVTFTAVLPDHIQLHATSDSAGFNAPTQPYSVEAFNAGGTSIGDVTDVSPLSISPEGSCDNTLHRCTGTAIGLHTVTATYSAGVTDTASLDVIGAHRIQLAWDHAPEVRVGDLIRWRQVAAVNEADQFLADVSDQSTVTISPDGTCDVPTRTCTAVHPGTHTVTATYNDSGTDLTDSFDVDVSNSLAVDHIEIRDGSSTVAAGEATAVFHVVGVDAYGNDIEDMTANTSIGFLDARTPDDVCDQAAHTCVATTVGVYTVHVGGANAWEDTTTLTVTPAAVNHLVLTGGNDTVRAYEPTNPYVVHGLDAYGNDVGDVTADTSLSIGPEGTCDNDASDDDPEHPTVHTCTAFVGDSLSPPYSRHTVTATYSGVSPAATGTSTVFVHANQPPFAAGPPQVSGGTDSVRSTVGGFYYQTTKGSFTLQWGRAQDPEGAPITYTLQRRAYADSAWVTLDTRIPTSIPNVSYVFGGVHPAQPEGTWFYRVIASDGGNETIGPESLYPIIVDNTPPTSTDNIPSSCQQILDFAASVSATDGTPAPPGSPPTGRYAVEKTYYTWGTNPPDPTTSSPSFGFGGPQGIPGGLRDGQKVKYFSVDEAGNVEAVHTSRVLCADITNPTTTDDAPATVVAQPVTLTLTATDDNAGIDKTYYAVNGYATTDSDVYDPSNKPILHNLDWFSYFSVDKAGNVEDLHVHGDPVFVDNVPPITGAYEVPPESAFTNLSVRLYLNDQAEGDTFIGASGVCETKYLLQPPGQHYDAAYFDAHAVDYDDSDRPVLPDETWRILFRSVDCLGNVQPIQSAPFQIPQSIYFTTTPPNGAFVGDVYTPGALAPDTGYEVTFTASGACAMSGADVLATSTGICTVTAHQDGDLIFDPADPVSQTYPVAAFRAPANFQATGGVRSIAMTWNPPSGLSASSIKSYVLTATAGPVVVTKTVSPTACTGSPSLCAGSFTGLANGTSYDVTVLARTAAADGAPAGASATTFSLPSAPQNFVAAPGDGQAVLNWNTSVADGGSPITAYRVRLVVGGVIGSPTNVDPGACTGGACAYTVTGLTNGTRYGLRLTALTAVGESAVATATVTPVAPAGAPTSFQATGGVRSIALTWSPPGSTGGPPVTMYTVTATPAGGTAITKSVSPNVCSSPTGPCNLTLTMLANGTAYALTVAARTTAGTGAAATANATTTGVPSAPQNLVVTPGDGQAGLTWNPPTSDGGAPMTYRVRVLLNDAVQTTTDLDPSTACSGGPCGFTATGLRNGTRYVLRVTAFNVIGEGPMATLPVTPVGPAPAPDGFQATGGVRSIAVNWFPMDNPGGLPVLSYVVTATKSGGATVTKGLSPTVCTGAPAVCFFTFNGLANGASYDVTVAAKTALGTGAAATANATTFGLPSAPQNLAGAPGDAQAVLSWTAPASDGGTAITGYRVRLVSGGVIGPPIDLDPSASPYTVTGLTNGVRYGLRLTAVNAAGESPVVAIQVTPHS